MERDSDCFSAAFNRRQLVATDLRHKSLRRRDASVDDEISLVLMWRVGRGKTEDTDGSAYEDSDVELEEIGGE